MRFYESDSLEHIGFDFYCDIANNIVKARKEKGITQKELAKLAGIKEHRLVGIENVKVRIDLDDLEKLSKVFERTVDWLIDAELDYGGKDCMYLVWPDFLPNFKLYMKLFNADKAQNSANAKWRGVFKQNMEGKGLSWFKGIITSIERSNNFTFQWDKENNEKTLVGAVFQGT